MCVIRCIAITCLGRSDHQTLFKLAPASMFKCADSAGSCCVAQGWISYPRQKRGLCLYLVFLLVTVSIPGPVKFIPSWPRYLLCIISFACLSLSMCVQAPELVVIVAAVKIVFSLSLLDHDLRVTPYLARRTCRSGRPCFERDIHEVIVNSAPVFTYLLYKHCNSSSWPIRSGTNSGLQ